MHANALESLSSHILPSALKPSPRVLDVGSGSGYLTHAIAEMAGAGCRVVGIEHVGALAELARANMGKSAEGRALLDGGRVRFVCGDGRKGWAEGAVRCDPRRRGRGGGARRARAAAQGAGTHVHPHCGRGPRRPVYLGH